MTRTIQVDIGTRHCGNFVNAVVGQDGVVRWPTNGRVPFDDVLGQMEVAGAITSGERTASNKARDRETAESLREYRKRPPRITREEHAEMRAAFGRGTTVVNVITGRRTRL